MKRLARIASGAGLVLTIAPSLLVFQGSMDLDTAKLFMLTGTALWFASAPAWMNRVTGEVER
jgi:high-affinity Fe2+/Pb2+ permease